MRCVWSEKNQRSPFKSQSGELVKIDVTGVCFKASATINQESDHLNERSKDIRAFLSLKHKMDGKPCFSPFPSNTNMKLK